LVGFLGMRFGVGGLKGEHISHLVWCGFGLYVKPSAAWRSMTGVFREVLVKDLNVA